MSDEIMNVEDKEPRKTGKVANISRGALQIAGGAIPFPGGVLSAVAGAWSEGEQEKVNRFFKHWIQMLQDELKQRDGCQTYTVDRYAI